MRRWGQIEKRRVEGSYHHVLQFKKGSGYEMLEGEVKEEKLEANEKNSSREPEREPERVLDWSIPV